jgi:hypothetical protein
MKVDFYFENGYRDNHLYVHRYCVCNLTYFRRNRSYVIGTYLLRTYLISNCFYSRFGNLLRTYVVSSLIYPLKVILKFIGFCKVAHSTLIYRSIYHIFNLICRINIYHLGCHYDHFGLFTND